MISPVVAPLLPNDVAVTLLPGRLAVSTRAVTQFLSDFTTKRVWETWILGPSWHVEGNVSLTRTGARAEHERLLEALWEGTPATDIGELVLDHDAVAEAGDLVRAKEFLRIAVAHGDWSKFDAEDGRVLLTELDRLTATLRGLDVI